MNNPTHYEEQAIAAEKREDWDEAAKQWMLASSASIGHKRAARYEQRAAKAREAAARTPKTLTDPIEEIGREHLGVDTLETRNSDSLDFHELPVWTLHDALTAAYQAGRRAERKAGQA